MTNIVRIERQLLHMKEVRDGFGLRENGVVHDFLDLVSELICQNLETVGSGIEGKNVIICLKILPIIGSSIGLLETSKGHDISHDSNDGVILIMAKAFCLDTLRTGKRYLIPNIPADVPKGISLGNAIQKT